VITVYTKADCKYCTFAKQLLRFKQIEYDEVKVGEDIPRDTVVELFPNVRTLPIIVVNGVNIGGYDNLVQYLKEDQSDTDDNLILG
jgi:glutaredoxin